MSVTSDPLQADLTGQVNALAGTLASALGGAVGAVVDAGPADDQDSVDELLPPDGGWATAAEVHSATTVVTVLVAPDLADQIAAGGSPWTALVDDVLQQWGHSAGVAVEPCVSPVPAANAGGLVPGAADLRLCAAGLFVGDRHVATVGVMARSLPERAHPLPETARRAPDVGPLQALAEVEMAVTAELGRARMSVAELLALAPGAVIELDRTAGSPIDLLVNGTLIARGEVVVVDEDFGVRLTEIVGPVED